MREFFNEHKKICLSAAMAFFLLIAFWLLSRYLSPAPPKSFVFTAGASDGAYFKYAMRYKAILAKDRITLEVRESKGSVENIQRLEDKSNDVLAGFVQGGLGVFSQPHDPETANFDKLQALANVAYEPVWVFTRDAKITNLAQLKDKRVAIGAQGSGTRKVALDLLGASKLVAADEKWLPLGAGAAIAALKNKEIDAVVTVAAPEAASVQTLLHLPGLHLADLTYAAALSRLYPYLQTIQIPRGVLDLASDIPARDITMLSTSANLVVSETLHPALAYLLLDAAAQVHGAGGALNRPAEFPHSKGTDYPVSDDAKRYFTTGKPFLQRYMPFWAANFLHRFLLVLIPLLAILVPLIKLFPVIQKFPQERKLFRLYGQLKLVEIDIKTDSNLAVIPAKLDAIDKAIDATKFAKIFVDRVYTLRQHVDFVRQSLK